MRGYPEGVGRRIDTCRLAELAECLPDNMDAIPQKEL